MDNVARVEAVSVNRDHGFSKANMDTIRLVRGLGVEHDAHFGETVQHLHLVKKDPGRVNLRQVHLIALERINEWESLGHPVRCGALGENITTGGIDLEHLPDGTRLRFPGGAEILLTGLRKPCHQVESFSPGLLRLATAVAQGGEVPYRIGVMGVVTVAGEVSAGEEISVLFPPGPHRPMVQV